MGLVEIAIGCGHLSRACGGNLDAVHRKGGIFLQITGICAGVEGLLGKRKLPRRVSFYPIPCPTYLSEEQRVSFIFLEQLIESRGCECISYGDTLQSIWRWMEHPEKKLFLGDVTLFLYRCKDNFVDSRARPAALFPEYCELYNLGGFPQKGWSWSLAPLLLWQAASRSCLFYLVFTYILIFPRECFH